MEKYDLYKLNKANKYEVEYIDYELIVDSKFLWNFRNNNKLTQVRLANILNVSKKTIEKWEQGANPIKGTSAVLIYLLNSRPELINLLIKENRVNNKLESNININGALILNEDE